MEPTVDLKINSTTGQHKLAVILDQERAELDLDLAAKLAADISTVLSFALSNGNTLHRVATDVEHVDGKTQEVPILKWHRVTTGRYKADIGSDGSAEVFKHFTGKGWNLKINGKQINDVPIAKKADLYEQVARMLGQTV